MRWLCVLQSWPPRQELIQCNDAEILALVSGLFFSGSASFEQECLMNVLWIAVFNYLMEINRLNTVPFTVFKIREQFAKSFLGKQHPKESFIGAFLIKVNFCVLPQISLHSLELGNTRR